jgi:hypothetical protein
MRDGMTIKTSVGDRKYIFVIFIIIEDAPNAVPLPADKNESNADNAETK